MQHPLRIQEGCSSLHSWCSHRDTGLALFQEADRPWRVRRSAVDENTAQEELEQFLTQLLCARSQCRNDRTCFGKDAESRFSSVANATAST